VALGAAAIAIAVILLSGGGGGYLVRAEFHDAGGLRKDSSVKIAGVTGGTVQSITVTSRDTAIATFKLDSNAAPIGAGASVAVRPTDLLGERYAQLDVGDLSHPQPSGALIPISRTSQPVELDDILNTFNGDTRTRLRILINEAGVALAGRGADFNTLLSELPPNIDQARQLLAQVASQNATLSNLIAEGDRITAAVNAKHDDLGNLVNVAGQALGTVASRQAQLSATLQNAPGALSQLQGTLGQLSSASQAIIPAAAELQRTAGPLTGTLQALPAFTSSAKATLATATRVAPDLIHLAVQARRPVRDLGPTAANLQLLMQQAVPIFGELDSRAMRDILWFLENWALAMKSRDSIGHFVGAKLVIDPAIITSALDSFLNGTPVSAAHRTAAAPRSAPGATPAPASTSSGTPAPGLLGGVANLLGPVKKLLNPVTNLVGNTVGGVLGAAGKVAGGLLGGGKQAPSSQGSSGQKQPNNVSQLLNYLLGQ
jgi:phospholipid/cholesterol/gamma-HCH transport system substrate-binding protein